MHMNRYKAFATHFGISATVVGSFLALTFFVWYPDPLFTVEGTLLPIQILTGVDVVLGPLLTLIVFKPGKKGLKFDLGMIAVVQLSAFIYGASIVFTERPAFVAFSVDRFTVIPRAEIDNTAINKIDPASVKLNFIGPTYVYAKPPDDPEVAQQIMLEALDGKPDIDKRPEYYRDLTSNIAKNYDHAINLEKYGDKIKEAKPLIDAFMTQQGKQFDQVAAYPLSGKLHDMVIVLDKESRQILGEIDINPWIKT